MNRLEIELRSRQHLERLYRQGGSSAGQRSPDLSVALARWLHGLADRLESPAALRQPA